jgi:hypothetical protein
MERPYTDTIEDNSCVIREFDENIDPIELMWHRDNEHRIIEAVELTDWLVQFDNELPISLDKPIFIPKHAWHRTIKGTGKLRIKITKL